MQFGWSVYFNKAATTELVSQQCVKPFGELPGERLNEFFCLFAYYSELKPILAVRGWVQRKPLYVWTAWRLRTSGRMKTSPGTRQRNKQSVFVRAVCLICAEAFSKRSSFDGKSVTCCVSARRAERKQVCTFHDVVIRCYVMRL